MRWSSVKEMSEEALLKSHFKTGEEMRRRNMAGGEIWITGHGLVTAHRVSTVQAGIGYPMGFAIDLWQNPYTMAKLMIYGFCHVMGFPIVPWQNPWVL